MKIKVGSKIHNIFKRECLTVISIRSNMVELKNQSGHYQKMSLNNLIKMAKASPLNIE